MEPIPPVSELSPAAISAAVRIFINEVAEWGVENMPDERLASIADDSIRAARIFASRVNFQPIPYDQPEDGVGRPPKRRRQTVAAKFVQRPNHLNGHS